MKATARAGSNIAFVKYWGNLDDELRIPVNGSISMTLDTAFTVTSVAFAPGLATDRLVLNDQPAEGEAAARVAGHLDHIRRLAGQDWKAHVVSTNSFPTGAGIASSASGFAALTVAACGALGLDLSRREMSRIARLGSGSACRSIEGGFVEWLPGGRHENSYAIPLIDGGHWDLVDIIAIISREHKTTGSSAGHPLAHTSPFFQARLGTLQFTLQQVRNAILDRDFAEFGRLIEEEAIYLHVAAMTSRPSVLYWQAGTLNLMHALKAWRQEPGGPVGYFTMDAGPNVHIITRRPFVADLLERLNGVAGVQDTLVCQAGPAAQLLEVER